MAGYAFALRTPRYFLEAPDQPLTLETGQPLDPEQAVQLIDLMLVADRAQALRFLGVKIAVDVLTLYISLLYTHSYPSLTTDPLFS